MADGQVLIEEGLHFDKAFPEMYVAFLMDRKSGGPIMVASREGGMDIEEVAKRNPTAILKVARVVCRAVACLSSWTAPSGLLPQRNVSCLVDSCGLMWTHGVDGLCGA